MTELKTETKETPKYVARMSLTDLPRDPHRCMGAARAALLGAFNYARKYPRKMTYFKNLMHYVLGRIEAWEEYEAAAKDQIRRTGILTEAESLGLDLDERATTVNLDAELGSLKAKWKAGVEAKLKADADAEVLAKAEVEAAKVAVKQVEDKIEVKVVEEKVEVKPQTATQTTPSTVTKVEATPVTTVETKPTPVQTPKPKATVAKA